MRFSIGKNRKQWKDSISIATALFAFIGAILTITGLSLSNTIPDLKWWVLLFAIIGTYVVLVILVYITITLFTLKGIKLKINGTVVLIKQGNLFEAKGWKIISFNEYFDTKVDNKIIAKETINGKFILEHVDDIKKLKNIINSDDGSPLVPITTTDKRRKYPLGHIKRYENEYMLLAFAHFNEQNMAYLSRTDYESCLRNMWNEISRTYANIPVTIPLLGSGIARFDDWSQKTPFALMKCMLCTLKTSGQHFNKPITIILTKETIREINIYELKGER